MTASKMLDMLDLLRSEVRLMSAEISLGGSSGQKKMRELLRESMIIESGDWLVTALKLRLKL